MRTSQPLAHWSRRAVASGLQRSASCCRSLQRHSLESLVFLVFLRFLGLLLLCGLGVRFPPGSPTLTLLGLVEPGRLQSSWRRPSGSPNMSDSPPGSPATSVNLAPPIASQSTLSVQRAVMLRHRLGR